MIVPGSALLAVLALGCTSPDTGQATGPLDDVQAHISEVVPTVVHVSWSTDTPGRSWVEYGLETALDQQTPATEVGTDHSQALLGLKAGRTWSWRAITELESGDRLESEIRQIALSPPPPELVGLSVTESVPGAHEGGFILTSQIREDWSFVVILDRDGDVVWYMPSADGQSIPTTELSLDGHAIVYTHNDRRQLTDTAGTVRIDLDGTHTVVTRNRAGHHDFAELSNDRVAWLSFDYAEAAYDDGQPTRLAGDEILVASQGTLDPDAAQLVFSYFDDLPQDPWCPCDHCEAEHYDPTALDWTHANSLMANEERGVYHLMSRNLDHLLQVDAETGEVLWQMGGRYSDFEMTDGQWWSHAHMSQIWDGGMMVFDNAYHDEQGTGVSRLVEYAFDEQAREVREVWSWPDPEGRFMPLLGDALKLPSGNRLGCWSAAGQITEIDPEGQVVWSLESDLGAALGRITWIESLYGS